MIILPNSTAGQTQNAGALPTALLNLKVGQIISVNITQIQGNQALIAVGNQTLSAHLQGSTLQTGLQQVEIKQTQPALLLAVLPNSAQAAQTTQSDALNSQQATLQTHYKQLLANQQPLTQVLQQLSSAPALSQNIQTVIGQVLEQLLKPNASLNGQKLKETLQNSGLMLESKLAKGEVNAAAQDLKTQLLRLQQLIKNEPPASPHASALAQLSKAVGEGIQKITLQQLQLFEHPELLNVELPVEQRGQINALQVGIYQKQAHGQTRWEVLLELQLNEAETLFKLTLNDAQDTLYCAIWCDSLSVEQTLREKLPQLTKQLASLGLQIPAVHFLPQKPAQPDFTTRIALIDVKV